MGHLGPVYTLNNYEFKNFMYFEIYDAYKYARHDTMILKSIGLIVSQTKDSQRLSPGPLILGLGFLGVAIQA